MFMSRIRSPQEAEKYTKSIQRLLVDDFRMVEKLLPLCANLESLVLLIDPSHASFLYPAALLFTNLRRLSILWEMLPSEHRSFHHPIFHGLTHLEIDPGDLSFWGLFQLNNLWDGLFQLNNLVHLRLNISHLRDIDDILYRDLFERVFITILSRLPTSTRYFTCVFGADQREIIDRRVRPGFFTNIQNGRFDPRFNLAWSPPIPQTYATWIAEKKTLRFKRDRRDVEDAVDSWIHLPHHYHDFWRRSEDEIDERRRLL